MREVIGLCTAGVKPWPLLISGTVGVGKTCAMLALCDHAPGSRYWTLEGFCELLLDARNGRAVQSRGVERVPLYPQTLWEEIDRCPLLAIDEIGAREKVSDFTYSTLQRLLDARAGRPTAIATNLLPAQLRSILDDRIVSRMYAGTSVHVEGPDRRARRVA